jgi:predicted O-methyltransferase YrrM
MGAFTIIFIGILGIAFGIGGLIYALIQKIKFNSPFLYKYPIGHPASPIPDMKEVRKRAKTIYRAGVTEIPGVNLNTDAQLALLISLAEYRKEMPLQEEARKGFRFSFNNFFFTGTDAILLYSLLRHYKPKRVVEIGSGFSSAVMLDTREAFPEIGTEFTFIEPYPQRLNALIKDDDRKNCTIIEKVVQDVDISHFMDLRENDMIFVDTSHQMKVGSEVLYLFFEIMPRLKPGVMIHFHDVFWPFEYPEEWVEIGRSWNESYGLRTFLQYNDCFEILFFNSYLGNVHKKIIKEKMPFGGNDSEDNDGAGGNFYAGGSLWLRKMK